MTAILKSVSVPFSTVSLMNQVNVRRTTETRQRKDAADEHVWKFHDKYNHEATYAECVECSHVIGFLVVTPEISL